MSNRYDSGHDDQERKEASLKDALLPAKPRDTKSPGQERGRTPARHGADKPSLQEALLPEGHRPSPPPAGVHPPKPDAPKHDAPRPKAAHAAAPEPNSPWVIPAIVAIAIALGFVVMFTLGRLSANREVVPVAAVDGAPPAEAAANDGGPDGAAVEAEDASPEPPPAAGFDDPGPMSLAEIQEKGLIIDVHEHIASLEQAPMFIAAMDKLGIQTMCLMGSSKFTLTLNEAYGFTEYDENNEELLKIVEAYPGRFEAWPTVNPEDPKKLEKIQNLVARGASGVKLYIGHGYVSRNHTYMFHTVAIDDPGMMPLYAWCEENYIPIMLHVNPFGEKVGFAQEFIAVLKQHPDLKVIAPHFALSSVYNPRLEELLATFPNLYSDVSFGDYFMAKRLTYMSKYPDKFQRIFAEYPDRFMFAADLVMIPNRPDDWAPTQLQAYIDMLSKEKYTSAAITEPVQGGRREVELTGMNLSDDLLSRILFRNYRAFRASRPSGTKITREIDWGRMNQEPVEREPGQAFPPIPKVATPGDD